MTSRDPHLVLGVARDASPAIIKAAWRRLARQHHPDLAAGDSAAARAATRRMAEINAAYEALTTGAPAAAGPTAGRAGRRASEGERSNARTHAHAPAGAPRPRPGKPVTGRVDMTGTFRTNSQPSPPPRVRPVPRRDWRQGAEPLRASDPNGPLYRRTIRRRRPPQPALAAALATPITFGKFHGHTLGEIASFEPSYIDWIVASITRDHDLVAAARVVKGDLDRRGVVRIRRPSRVPLREAIPGDDL